MSNSSLTPDEAINKAGKLASRGDASQAIGLLNAVLTQNPANKKAKKALRALQSTSDAPLSESDFRRVHQLMERGHFDAARAEAQRLCRRYPSQPALHNLLAVILVRLDERDVAVKELQTALAIEPHYSEALGNLASVLADLERYEEALNAYQELARRNHLDADGYLGLGRALRGAKRTEEAVEAYRRSIKLRPINVDAYNNLGNVLNDLGRHDEAVEAYESALGIDRQHPKALLNYAQSLLGLRRSNAALGIFADFLKLNPRNTVALKGMASALMRLEQRTAAAEKYEQLLQIDPQDHVARHMLAALGDKRLDHADPAYARNVFEDYAARFDKHLTETLEYNLPQRIPGMLQELDGEDAWYEKALDLGCGTGLVGVEIRSFCSELVGLDVAQAMVTKAQEKAVYDELFVNDIMSWFQSTNDAFNLIICAEVVVYIGGLTDLFQACYRHTAAGGRLLLSTEQIPDGEFVLRDSGRYAHSAAYVQAQAEKAGFRLSTHKTINLRKEKGAWLEGGVFILDRD